MCERESSELSPEEMRIAGALQVVRDGSQEVVKVGDAQIAVPSVSATSDEMDKFNRFLATTRLAAIERKKQKQMREIRAAAEVEVLEARTQAIVKAHKGLAGEALMEILIAANQFGRDAIRRDELAEQGNVQRAILKAAIQYSEFIKEVPTDLPEGVRSDVLEHALEVYKKTLDRIRTTDFKVELGDEQG
ncbi:MAG: hypothetical protein JXR94_14685 [Candidatus Hydrogenedentes bacterium]|nr:hypothetical protein [Candidatus Hydrogenedentota bacterium]